MSDNFAYRCLKQFDSTLRKFATAIDKGVLDSKTNAFARGMRALAKEFTTAFNDIEY